MSENAFVEFLKASPFMSGAKVKKQQSQKKDSGARKTPSIKKNDEFFKSITEFVSHFDTSIKRKRASQFLTSEFELKQQPKNDEFNEAQITAGFKATEREVELRQQKKIIQLFQKVHMLTKEIVDTKRSNSELYGECKRQKELIKEHQRVKYNFETYKVKSEKKIEIIKQQQEQNSQIIRQLKPVLNIAIEEQEKYALSIAKKEIRSQLPIENGTPQNTIASFAGPTLPALKANKETLMINPPPSLKKQLSQPTKLQTAGKVLSKQKSVAVSRRIGTGLSRQSTQASGHK